MSAAEIVILIGPVATAILGFIVTAALAQICFNRFG